MTTFIVSGRKIQVTASFVPRESTQQVDAWHKGEWISVRVDAPIEAIRVHTNGRTFSDTDVMWERLGSKATGAWAAIGDVILTSSQMVDASALPGVFIHVAAVIIPQNCIVNIGVNGATLMGRGGGVQAEYVKGPRFEISELKGKVWMDRAGRA